jgi:tRNA1(Val) A37 N6-methylase TrmN6
MADYFGENYQDEYYIRDCAAGTGNLLAGLTNKYNIYASTLDMADVQVMKEMADLKTANLLKEHIFQFDFLNDSFDKLPQSLQAIINDPEKRKKLIIYINPPYAETATNKTTEEGRMNKR